MTELLYILENISLPIILLIAAGFVFEKIFKMDTGVVSKLLLYLIVPVMIFIKLCEIDITLEFFILLVLFMVILQALMYLLAVGLSAIMKFNRSTKSAVVNAMVLMNIGNYGLPLINLVFSGSLIANASQIFIIVIQNVVTYTFGVFQVSSGQSVPRKKVLRSIVRMPAIYAILLAVIVKLSGFQIPGFIKIPGDYITQGFIAVALIALGMQLAEVRFGKRIKDLIIVSAVKVVAVPVAAFGIIALLGVKGLLASALIIGVSTPTAVNTAILAREFKNEPDFAAQIVLLTTIMCTFSLPFVIYFAKTYYGFS